MHASLLELLVDPVSRTQLALETRATDADETLDGALWSRDGRSYPVVQGIPRFVLTEDGDQLQSAESFGFKWQQLASYDSPSQREMGLQWLIRRHGFANEAAMRQYFRSRRRILDAGCGSGFTSSLWLEPCETMWVGADISVAVDVARKRLGHIANTHFVQGDVLSLPFKNESFDAIVSEGVLHHTPDTAKALGALVPLLAPGGEITFYVYRKKAPIREFSDDYIREVLSAMPPAEAWEALRPLTKLGQALAQLRVDVEVPEDVPFLGIKAGRHDVQRLIYWHVAKLFWNDAFSFDENHHINFDWYHPRYAHRHTEEEIRQWCNDFGLTIEWFWPEESGFTVRARKLATASAA